MGPGRSPGRRGELTRVDAVYSLCLPQDAVGLPHFAESGFRPTFLSDDWFNLVSQRLEILGLLREVV